MSDGQKQGLRPMDPRRMLHAYGGVEHAKPGPIDGCLLCELDEAVRVGSSMAQFIGSKGLGDEYTEWAIAQLAEIDRLLADES